MAKSSPRRTIFLGDVRDLESSASNANPEIKGDIWKKILSSEVKWKTFNGKKVDNIET